jgi:hypothetical protein
MPSHAIFEGDVQRQVRPWTSFGVRAAAGAVAALVATAILVGACSNNSGNPTPPVYTVTGDGGPEAGEGGTTTPSDAGDAGDASDAASDADTGATKPPSDSSTGDSSGPTGEAGTEAGAEAGLDAGCDGEAGCWSCAPTSTTEFLNQCTSSQCTPFNNLQRLPDYDGGALPPLP